MKLVTTPEAVYSLTKTILTADAGASSGRETYLQSLILATQKALGAAPRERSGRGAKLDAEGIKAQLDALTTAHEVFYPAVLKACSENLPGTVAKGKELNRRSNFARTALYSVRTWIRSGKDVTALAATKVTKGGITVKREPRELTPRRLLRRVERGITELIEQATQLAAQDKGAAVSQLEAAMGKITLTLATLGVSATRDPAVAQKQHKPLRTRSGTFYPIGTPAALAGAV